MKKAEVKIGAVYKAKISNQITEVRIVCIRFGGWDAVNLKTNRHVHIKSAAKLREEVK